MDHSCTVHRSVSCHCQHPTNPTLLPQLQKRCGREGYYLQGKTKYFPGQGKATRKIWRENCYSLKIAVWDSNDSHLRPMTSASELGTQRRGKKFYKEGWEQGIRQVSEEHISSALKWLNAHSILSRQPWYWALSTMRLWGPVQLREVVCLLTDTVCQNSSCWPPKQYVPSVTFSLVCLKLQASMCHWGFS